MVSLGSGLVLEKIIIKHHKRKQIPGSKLRCGLDDQHGAERMWLVGKPVQQHWLGTAPVSSQASRNSPRSRGHGCGTPATSGMAQTEKTLNAAIEKRNPWKMLLEARAAPALP